MERNHRYNSKYHNKEVKSIIISQDFLKVRINKKNERIETGVSFTLTPNTIHRMKVVNSIRTYSENSSAELNDVVRTEDDYKKS